MEDETDARKLHVGATLTPGVWSRVLQMADNGGTCSFFKCDSGVQLNAEPAH
jgi:hypothetical protein